MAKVYQNKLDLIQEAKMHRAQAFVWAGDDKRESCIAGHDAKAAWPDSIMRQTMDENVLFHFHLIWENRLVEQIRLPFLLLNLFKPKAKD